MKFRANRALLAAVTLALFASACSGSTETSTTVDVAPVAADPTQAPPTSTTAPVAEPTQPPAAQPDPDPAAEPEPVAEEAVAEETATEETTPAEPEPAVTVVLPEVEVYDLSTGGLTALQNVARPGPTLLWFWAPH